MPRLFSGLELTSDIRSQLSGLRTPIPGARWIEEENLHLTLRFFGDIDNGQAREVVSSLQAIEQHAFALQLAGLGVFTEKDPRTLWAGVVPNPSLRQLAQANEAAARAAGLKPQSRKFVGHVTLARLRQPRIEALARFLQHNGGYKSRLFSIQEFVLFSSRPRTGGGPYAVEDAFALIDHDYENLAEEFRS